MAGPEDAAGPKKTAIFRAFPPLFRGRVSTLDPSGVLPVRRRGSPRGAPVSSGFFARPALRAHWTRPGRKER